jgi:hypothetical protein
MTNYESRLRSAHVAQALTLRGRLRRVSLRLENILKQIEFLHSTFDNRRLSFR